MEPKIILQDSDLKTANDLRSVLTLLGYTVVTVKTLKGIKGLIEKTKPNLLIVECDNDDDKAAGMVSDFKKRFNMKVIATSCDDKRLFLMQNIGFDDCLTKPFNYEDVQKVIMKQLAA
jgi:DNA-binding response OmpR family regulator